MVCQAGPHKLVDGMLAVAICDGRGCLSRSHEGPVLLVRSAGGNPPLQGFNVCLAELLTGTFRWHDLIRIEVSDAGEKFAGLYFTGLVEPQLCFAGRSIRTVTREAVFRQDWSDITGVARRLVNRRFLCRGSTSGANDEADTDVIRSYCQVLIPILAGLSGRASAALLVDHLLAQTDCLGLAASRE